MTITYLNCETLGQKMPENHKDQKSKKRLTQKKDQYIIKNKITEIAKNHKTPRINKKHITRTKKHNTKTRKVQ